MIRVGSVQLQTNLLLAPIAGYCDLAFRTICREQGFEMFGHSPLGLACTDLLSPQGLLRGTATSLDLARTTDEDKPGGMARILDTIDDVGARRSFPCHVGTISMPLPGRARRS